VFDEVKSNERHIPPLKYSASELIDTARESKLIHKMVNYMFNRSEWTVKENTARFKVECHRNAYSKRTVYRGSTVNESVVSLSDYYHYLALGHSINKTEHNTVSQVIIDEDHEIRHDVFYDIAKKSYCRDTQYMLTRFQIPSYFIHNELYTVIGLIAYSIPSDHPLFVKPKRNCLRVSTDGIAKMCYQTAGTVYTSKLFTFCRITYSPDPFTKSNRGMNRAVLSAFHTQCKSIENTLKRDYLSDMDLDEEHHGDDEMDITATSPPATPMGYRHRAPTHNGGTTSSGTASLNNNGYFLLTPSPPEVIGSQPAGINMDHPPKPCISPMARSFPKPPAKESYKQQYPSFRGFKPPSVSVIDDAVMHSDVDHAVPSLEDFRAISASAASPQLHSVPSMEDFRAISASAMSPHLLNVLQYGSPQYGASTPEPVSFRKRNGASHGVTFQNQYYRKRPKSANSRRRHRTHDPSWFLRPQLSIKSNSPRRRVQSDHIQQHRGQILKLKADVGPNRSRRSQFNQHHHHMPRITLSRSNVVRHHDSHSSRSKSSSRRSRRRKDRNHLEPDPMNADEGIDRSRLHFAVNDAPSASARELVRKQQGLHDHHSIHSLRTRPKSATRCSRRVDSFQFQKEDKPSSDDSDLLMSSPSSSARYRQHHRQHSRSLPSSNAVSIQELLNPLDDSVFPCPRSRWVPDRRADQCMRCHTEFERSVFFISGKHHCRKCGSVVCGECSNQRLKGHRVCTECYRKYKRFEHNNGSGTTHKRTLCMVKPADPMRHVIRNLGHVMGDLSEEESEQEAERSVHPMHVGPESLRRRDSLSSEESDYGTVITVDGGDSDCSHSSRMEPMSGDGMDCAAVRMDDFESKLEPSPGMYFGGGDEEKGFAAKSFDLFMESCSMKAGFNRRYLLKFIENGYDDIRMMEFIDKQILLEEIGFQNRLSMNLILHRVEWLKESQQEFKDILINKLKLPKRYLLLFNERGIVNMEYLVRFANDGTSLQREIGITVRSHLDALCRELREYQMGSGYHKLSNVQESEGTETELSYQPGANGLDNTPLTPKGGTLLGHSLTVSPAISAHSVHSHSPRSMLTSPSDSNSKMYGMTKLGIITHREVTLGGNVVAEWKRLKENEWESLWKAIEGVLKGQNEEWTLKGYEVMMGIVIQCHEVLVSLKAKMTASKSLEILKCLMSNIEGFYGMIGDEEKELKNKDLMTLLNHDILERIKMDEAMDRVGENVRWFVVRCCSVLWAVIESKYSLFPMEFVVEESQNGYDPQLHRKERASDCDTVRFCTFPAIVHDGVYLSKMYVLCIE